MNIELHTALRGRSKITQRFRGEGRYGEVLSVIYIMRINEYKGVTRGGGGGGVKN